MNIIYNVVKILFPFEETYVSFKFMELLFKLLASNLLFFLTILIMLIMIFYMYIRYRDYKEKLSIILIQNEGLEKSYSNIQKLYNDNEYVLHDFKNHLAVLTSYIKKKEIEKALDYISDISCPVQKIDNIVWTGIEIVDILLNLKAADAVANGVNFNFDILIKPCKVSDTDFCTILTNLLDNAIESSIKDIKSKRFVSFTMKSINKMLEIKIKNNMPVKPKRINNLTFVTTKENKKHHGIGLESVKCCINKYGGNIKFDIQKDFFQVTILLFSV